MPFAPFPIDELERQSAVNALGLVGTPSEARFDNVIRLALAAFQVQFAAINLIDADAAWIKANDSWPFTEAIARDMQHARVDTYCSWSILDDDITVICDSLCDWRVKDNPWAAHVRFYAAAPLRFQGKKIGALCIGGPTPRLISDSEKRVLRDLGDLVEAQFTIAGLSQSQAQLAADLTAARRIASVDGLTKAWSRDSIIKLAKTELARAKTGFLMIDIDHFKNVNDTYGHQTGDEVLRRVADRARQAIRASDAFGRYGGEEFFAVLRECSTEVMLDVAERIRRAIAASPIVVGENSIPVTVSIGAALGSPDHFVDLVLKCADEALYAAKKNGRNQVQSMQITSSLFARAEKLPETA